MPAVGRLAGARFGLEADFAGATKQPLNSSFGAPVV